MTPLDVTVCVGTYGNPEWQTLAAARAIPSARALGAAVVAVHDRSLHEARNAALAQVQTEWVVFLDADDQLEPGYLNAMATATADVRVPAVRYVRPSGVAAPHIARKMLEAALSSPVDAS